MNDTARMLQQARAAVAAAHERKQNIPAELARLNKDLVSALADEAAGMAPPRSAMQIALEIVALGSITEALPKVVGILEFRERQARDRFNDELRPLEKQREIEVYLVGRDALVAAGRAGTVPAGGEIDRVAGLGRMAGRGDEVDRLTAVFEYLSERKGRYGQKEARLLLDGHPNDRGLVFLTDEEAAAA